MQQDIIRELISSNLVKSAYLIGGVVIMEQHDFHFDLEEELRGLSYGLLVCSKEGGCEQEEFKGSNGEEFQFLDFLWACQDYDA